ncbi:MAG: DNA-protecting protein DprA [Deltaproteobacteria bacterium]|nr:MAG: DNA-protecting protein DprA [Deltaproteobacteria bacterium]
MAMSRWWAGARRFARGLDLDALARLHGGFQSLEAGGVDALVSAGVDPERAEAWVHASVPATSWGVLTLADARYPRALRSVPGAPPVLEYEGDLAALDAPRVAVVGTRACTAYGAAVARHLGHALASVGVTVVSGLARGIDGHAHAAAAEAGRTVAVVAHGLDHTAPATHRRLRSRLVARGGLVLSAWAADVEPRPWRFPVRNQWVAALAEAVVVVEAPQRSGALITAARAAELARDVVVVPGRLGDAASLGCLRLLAEGAEPIEDVERWVAERFGRRRPRREKWLEQLFAGHTVSEVARWAGCSGSDLLAELSRREVDGEVVRLPGQRYSPGSRSPT